MISPIVVPWALEKIRVRSPAKLFCRETQNLYNSTGSTPISAQAKKPFSTFSAAPLILTLPDCDSIATSNTAPTTPTVKSAQPNHSVHPAEAENLSAHIVHAGEQVCHRIKDRVVDPLYQCVPDIHGDVRADPFEHHAQGISQPREDIS